MAGEGARGLALPVRTLPANVGEFDQPHPLGERPERRARANGLKLLGVADQNELRPGRPGRRDKTRHLTRADHAGLVDHQNGAGAGSVAPRLPAMLPGGERARDNAGGRLEGSSQKTENKAR